MSPRIALVCSAHGFGHVTRQVALATQLLDRGAAVTLFSAAPPEIARETAPMLAQRSWVVDVGLAQPDSLHEDLPRTRELLAQRCSDRRIDALARALEAFDLVVVDVAPAGLEAARRAGRPALAVGNFDWAWIYGHYPQLSDWAATFAAWQAPHPAVSLSPGPGLHGFASVTAMGLLGRRLPAWRSPQPGQHVLVSFGGFGLDGLDRLLPVIDGVRWLLAAPMPRLDRPDCLWLADRPYPSLVAGADLVLSKPGYGIFAECSLAGTPLVWVPRGAFPEAPHLAQAMQARGDLLVPASPDDPDFAAVLADTVRARLAHPRPDPTTSDTAQALAEHVLALARRPSTS